MNHPEHSWGNDTLEALQEALRTQRQTIQKLRGDYAIIDRSKFARLRTIWLLFRSLFRRSGIDPPFATASGLAAHRAVGVADHQFKSAGERIVDELERRLLVRAGSSAASEPLVSVVIPAYNDHSVTERCLLSIVNSWPASFQCEIIVVDDASPDCIAERLTRLSGITLVRNAANVGFVGSCNRGAALTRGKYIVFLNNDTAVKDAWLDWLVNVAEGNARVGAVGSKLIYPDGRLQEAGGIIFRDGSGWNFGSNATPDSPEYNFSREVDYCSAAALLVRSDLFRSIGGFDAEFAPGYYEDVDLCFQMRSHGFKVMYEPRSEVIHYEGLSAGRNEESGMKRFQSVNRSKFVQKWHDTLQSHYENDRGNVWRAARRHTGRNTILVIDEHVPLYDRDAGSQRLIEILRILRHGGYHVIFAPQNFAAIQPYTTELLAMGVEQLYYNGKNAPLKDRLREALPHVDVAWICRPELAKEYMPLVREFNVPVVYDTIDLHFVRARGQAVFDKTVAPNAWKSLETLELRLASAADATVVVSEQDRQELLQRGARDVWIIPTIHNRRELPAPGFDKRRGVIFIGGYNHPPNVDAARWLCEEVMPLVWQSAPEVRVSLLGSNPPKEVYDLASERVDVVGYVPNADPYFLGARVFAAPLRYGAGMKGKIGHSLSFGLPVVTTTIGVAGFALQHEQNCLIADDVQGFADAILRLHSDHVLWDALSTRCSEAIRDCQSSVVAANLMRLLDKVTSRAGLVSVS